MVKYNPGNSRDILLHVSRINAGITVSMTDYDVDAFDVTAARCVDTEAPLTKRKVGGLGLHLIRKMVNTLEYNYADRQSTITFTKGFESAGLGVLLKPQKRLVETGVGLKIINVNNHIHDVFRYSGFNSIFEIEAPER